MTDDERLGPRQLLAMQRLDDAMRGGYLTRDSAEARRIEDMVRVGKVPGALRRITKARRGVETPSDPCAVIAGGSCR